MNWISESMENKDRNHKISWKESDKLMMSNDIDIEAALKKTKNRISEFRYRKRKKFFVPAAAVISILVSIAFSLKYAINLNTNINNQEDVVFQEVKAAYGTKTKLYLADGTTVWLNSGSTLKFPVSFGKLKERRVYLDGEGYFEVTKNELKPFYVNTEKVNIKVYGTSFNVFSYGIYNSMSVALVEGEVSLIEEHNDKQKELMKLKPLDVVECDFENNKIRRSSDSKIEKHTAWKDGYMVFYGDSIDFIIQRLEKWYNVDIEIEDKELHNYAFTATFHDEPLEQILYLLGLSSPMEYKIIPSRKLNDNTFSVRKVILTKKNNPTN